MWNLPPSVAFLLALPQRASLLGLHFSSYVITRQYFRCSWTAKRRRVGSNSSKTVVLCKAAPPQSTVSPSLLRVFETFLWRGYRINYRVDGPAEGEPVLLVHGFGASVGHWRKNIPVLAGTGRLRVYTVDLLGFGASEKPDLGRGNYCLELWRDLVMDFIQEMDCERPWALAGNSIGSLVSLMAVARLGRDRVRGLVLLNCAGGLTSFRYSELNPVASALIWLVNFVLFNPLTGPWFFRNFSTRENIRSVLLQQVYKNKDAVDDELVDLLHAPGSEETACRVFLAIVNGPPGPTPEQLLLKVPWCPILVLWGEDDPWTPLNRGMHPGSKFGKYHPNLELIALPNTGHCPHDDNPEGVHEHLIPFLLKHSRASQ